MAIMKERTKDVLNDDTNVNFESLYLSPPVLEALNENNFIKPSPIQLKAIPLGKCGLDLIVKSKSGTGKTAVFAIIALEMIDITKPNLQALILAPTREIAVQSCDVISTIGKHIQDLKVEHFIGGLPVKEDTSKAQGCHIAVASPGRILHLITSGTLDMQNVKLFVLDEADSLMESNFQADINKIFHSLPKSKQMLAVSATFPNELDCFLSQYMHIPSHVSATMDTPLLLGLKHFASVTSFNTNSIFLTKYKNNELLRLLTHVSFTQCLVFCNYQTRAEEVCSFLNTKAWKAEYISGAQTQKQRLEVLKKLKEFQCRILLSTDLTARGIDAINVDLVINYDVPNDESTYLHRMGRAGRYGSKGLCVTLAAKGAEVGKFCDIIGAIGGCEMSVPILPKENLPGNIWEAEEQVQEFARLQGTLKQQETNGNASKEQILRSVKEILQSDENVENNPEEEVNEKQKKASKTKKTKENKQATNKMTETVENDEEQDETTALLALLAAGKADSSVTKATPDKTSIFNKNLSLLTVSGLLDDDDVDINSDQTARTIESFIATLQEPETNENVQKQHSGVLDSTKPIDIEDVFTHAFNYAICKTKPNWAELYDYQDSKEETAQGEPVNLMQDLLEYVANQVNPDDEDFEDGDEEYYDYDENNDNEEAYEEGQPSMEWIPVENVIRDNASSASSNSLKQMCTSKTIPEDNVTLITSTRPVRPDGSAHYEGLFDSTMEYLEASFNTMESAPAFDTMWSQWQAQMNSVRDYVQQNIYLNEMATYRAAFQH